MNKLRWLGVGLQLSLPFIWKATVAAFEVVFITIFRTWESLFRLAREIADDWTEEAILSGAVTSEYTRFLTYLLFAVALVMVSVGWVITAHLTVWLVRFIF